MAKYNGHRNWNHWNVSLWLLNDESMYRLVRRFLRCASSKDQATEWLLEALPAETPDGAPFTRTAVRAALRFL